MTAPETTAAVDPLRDALEYVDGMIGEGLSFGLVDQDLRKIRARIRLALASQPPADGGWVLVPREPIEEQLKAGSRASLSTAVLLDDTRFACERATYRAMIAAAPLPVRPDQGEGK